MKKHSYAFRFLVLTLVVLIAIFTLLAFSGTGEEPVYQIAIVVPDSQNDRWANFRSGARQAAQDFNVELSYVTTDTFHSYQEQDEVVQEELLNGADALVLEPAVSKGTAQWLQNITNQAPLVLINSSASYVENENCATVSPDNRSLGRSLASEVIVASGGHLAGHKVGILIGNESLTMNQERKEVFEHSIEKAGGTITWTLSGVENIEEALQKEQTVDTIVCLDPIVLDEAIEYCGEKGIQLFGIGCSENSSYALDKGIIRSLLVVNDFNVGYQSIKMLHDKCANQLVELKDGTADYHVINKENMYTEDNEKLMFPMNH